MKRILCSVRIVKGYIILREQKYMCIRKLVCKYENVEYFADESHNVKIKKPVNRVFCITLRVGCAMNHEFLM